MIKTLFAMLGIATLSLAFQSDAVAGRPPLFKGFTSVVRVNRPPSPIPINAPLHYEPGLQVNPEVAYRMAAEKDEFSGIDDLRALSLNASLEEHWVFLPGKNLWIEIGFDEAIGAATIDFDFLEDLIRTSNELAIYHIHPRNYLKAVKDRQQREIPETWLAVPSFADVALMIYFTSRFHEIHPQGRLTWNVCSPLGRTTYGLSATGLAHYGNNRQDAFLLTYLYPSEAATAQARAESSASSFDMSETHDIHELIEWVNAQGKDHIEVEFFPYSAAQ